MCIALPLIKTFGACALGRCSGSKVAFGTQAWRSRNVTPTLLLQTTKKYSIADCRSESWACFGDYNQSSSSGQSCNGCDNLGGFRWHLSSWPIALCPFLLCVSMKFLASFCGKLVWSNLVSKCRIPRLSELCENKWREDRNASGVSAERIRVHSGFLVFILTATLCVHKWCSQNPVQCYFWGGPYCITEVLLSNILLNNLLF